MSPRTSRLAPPSAITHSATFAEAPEATFAKQSPLLVALQQLLEALPQGVALVGKRATVLMTNASWRQDVDSSHIQPGDTLQDVGYDELTGASNRRHFYEQAERTLNQVQQEKSAFSLVYIDLDHFKQVNDRYGHAVGDTLLVHVSARLQSLLRGGDRLARLGGDEFVLLLQDVPAFRVASVLERFREVLAAPYTVEGRELGITASLGEASFPGDGATIDELLRQADARMHTHKAATARDRIAAITLINKLAGATHRSDGQTVGDSASC